MADPCYLLDVCDEVAAQLSAQTFNLAFTAAVEFLPRYKVEELQTVKVSVIPRDDAGERESKKGPWQQDYKLGLMIQQALGAEGANETTQARALLLLGQQISDFYKTNRLTSNQAVLIENSYLRLFDPDHLEQHGVLTTVIALTFRGWR